MDGLSPLKGPFYFHIFVTLQGIALRRHPSHEDVISSVPGACRLLLRPYIGEFAHSTLFKCGLLCYKDANQSSMPRLMGSLQR